MPSWNETRGIGLALQAYDATGRASVAITLAHRRSFRLCLRSLRHQPQGHAVPESLADTRYELAVANRILGHEGVLDAFGHVSMRHPADPGRFLLSRSRSPQGVRMRRSKIGM